ncbi:hypothetical protein JTB14_031667 [Gonioctena quinquepunctata]|nr:hypothetical protein JTB14_031667 [Gonioctena quinquepunctata]
MKVHGEKLPDFKDEKEGTSRGNGSESESDNEFSNDSFPCTTCSKTFSMKKYLNSHMKTHTNPHKCKICSLEFSQKTHVKRAHPDGNKVEEDRPFPCPDCEKTYVHKRSLISHQKKCHPGEIINDKIGPPKKVEKIESKDHHCI